SSSFSTAAQYIFHVNSSASYGAAQTETQIICTFADSGNITCSVGGTEVISDQDASSTAGITNTGSTFRVFAGRRNDPFFFDLTNFNAARTTVRDAASGLTFDGAGCPTLDTGTRTALVNTLVGASGGVSGSRNPADNDFQGENVLSIVVQVDTSLLGSGPVYSVWGSTNRL
ncbi:MAG: DUF4331 family protein, partial [Pseudomonadota bacterium]